MKRGDVYNVSLDPTVGAEKQKTRPCVIVRRDMISEDAEQRNPLTIVVPVTDANGKAGNALNVPIPKGTAGMTKDSLVTCSQIRTVDKKRFGIKRGVVPAKQLDLIDQGLRVILGLA